MGIASDIVQDWDAALAALAWQLDCGADEALSDSPVNRYEAKPAPSVAAAVRAATAATPNPAMQNPAASAAMAPPPEPRIDPVAVASSLAAAAGNLEALRDAVQGFELCDLKKGARNTVFADGNPKARVLVLDMAPGREEDVAGRPFAGRAGQLLDRMFQAIGLSRQSPDAEQALYLTNVIFWRPSGDLMPDPAEIAMLRPFLLRHIELVDPEVIVTMGTPPLAALTGQRGSVRQHGSWASFGPRTVLTLTHPRDLLIRPREKAAAWADLLALQARLRKAG